MRNKLKEYSSRFLSVFLCISIFCFSVISPVSATGIDSYPNPSKIDVTPYFNKLHIDSSDTDSDGFRFLCYLDESQPLNYIDILIKTDDQSPSFYVVNGFLTVLNIGDNLFRVFGDITLYDTPNFFLQYYKSSSFTYLDILTCYITKTDYMIENFPLYYSISGNYTRRVRYRDQSGPAAFYDESFSISDLQEKSPPNLNIYTSAIKPNIYDDGAFFDDNSQRVLLTTYLYFDWRKYDSVDLYFNNSLEDLEYYTFYVGSINVLSSIQSVTLDGNDYTIISLDFSKCDRNLSAELCYLKFVGYRTLHSYQNEQIFYIYRSVGFVNTNSNNFWPSWLNKIINKLDNIFTGRTQDQSAANSFNDSIIDQSNELEDLTDDLNSVTRPPLSDVNLSTGTMVDSGTIVLATSGLGSIMSNTIILRVLLMSLTFALAGFILFGKR